MSAHARLGASNMSRWANCPGSVALEEGRPDRETDWAREGTAAHALAAKCIELRVPPSRWIGDEIEGWIVDQDMVDGVDEYLDVVGTLLNLSPRRFGSEQRVSLERIGPPEDMFGTTDFWAIVGPVLVVVDFKYGRGVVVDVKGNMQTRYYALGVWLSLPSMAQREIKTVRMIVVQPRVYGEDGEPSVSHEDISTVELLQWSRFAMERAEATQDSNAPRVTGSWCQFCKAKAICPEFRETALSVAQLEFADIAETSPPNSSTSLSLPTVTELTPMELARILELSPRLEEFLSEIKALARSELEAGREVPGFALKPSKGHRKWVNSDRVIGWLRDQGATDEDIFTAPLLKSPAQIEKLLPKGSRLPDGSTVTPALGYKLCSSDDPKAVSAPAELTALPPVKD